MPWLILTAAAALMGQDVPPRLLARLAEEAEVFGRMAPQVVGQESMEQVAAEPPPRFQPRGTPPQIPFKTHRLTAEYGFTYFKDDPGNLHELRQVLSVNGKTVKAPGKLRETLAMGMKGDTDRLKKKMIKEFQGYGMKDAATDFGQMVLMFQKRQLPGYAFRVLRTEYVGADRVMVCAYEQKEGDTAMTVFEGKQVVRHKMQGEVFLREQDGVPVRVTLKTGRKEKDLELRHTAVVDYQLSSYGMLLPVSVQYLEELNGRMITQLKNQYSDYKMFGASSDVKFTVEEDVVKK